MPKLRLVRVLKCLPVALAAVVSLPSVAQNLSAVSLSPTSVTGGTSSTGTVTLSANAPTGGKVVTLSSGNTAAATVPSSVTVAAGTKTKTFTVTTVPQAADASAVVSAAMSGVTKTATLTVKAPAMSAASVSPTSVTGGVGATLTVTLTGNAPAAGTTVTLTSGNTAAATLPASVAVAAGTKTQTAAVATSAVDANASVALTAAAGGVSKSATLTVARPVLASLALSPTTIPGGGTASGTVTLSGPAGPSGATVALSSSDAAAATVPATVPVAAGQSSGVFSVSGGVVASDRTARISATWASQTRQADLVVTRSIGRLTGSVTDVATGAPLPSARVQLQADPGLETWTDDLGRFELADVPAGAHAVVASLERYSTATSASVVVSGGQVVTIPPVALTPLTGTLFGTVVDFANGSAPLAGVTVTEATGLHTATTDAAGAFELAGLAPGVTFLVFRKEGYRPAVSWLLDVDGDFRRQVEQGMEPTSAEFSAGRIDGVVRDGSGAPVEGASVSVVGHEELAAVTGADGRYVLSVPPAAGWIVSATKAGHARAFSDRLNASAGTEPYHLAVDLVLPPEGSTGTLELRTFDPVGRAPFRSDFWFRTPVGVWHTPVPVAGSRTIAGVPAGQVWDCLGRRVLAPGQTLTVRCVGEPVVPPGTPRWAAAGMVANRYTAEPVAGATVTFVNGQTSIPLVTDENGLYSVVSAPVGEWSAAASGAGFLESPAWTFTATDDQQNGAFYGATFWPERPPGTLHVASPAEGDLITGPELSVAVGFAPDRPADQLLRVRPWASAGSVRGFTTVYSPDGLGASVAIDGDFPNGPLAVTIDAVSQTGGTLSTVRTVEIRRPSHPTAVAVSPAIAPAAGVATGTVVVDPPAPAGGVLVQLSSSIPSVEPPPSVTVAEGATTATFPVVIGDLGTTTVAVITAAAAGFEATAMLTVHPSSPAPLDTDLAEGSPAGWTAFADPPASASVSLDATHVKAGAAALRFVTDSGFDCGVRYSLSPGVHWDLRGIRFLTFWSRGETAEAFQGEQPVVVLRGPGGSIRYQPPTVETANGEWRFHRVPLGDASDWIVTTEGEPSLGLVTSLELHQDVWGAGMTVAYDGIAFVSQVPEDLAEGTASLWRTFASDGAATSVVDDSAETRSGASALRFDTASGFDTGLVFPSPANVRWDLSDVRTLTFWARAENTQAFQGNQPVVVLRSAAGSIRLEPGDVLLGTPGWRFFEVPLDGAFPWARTQEGTPDLANVTGIEIHADTWGYGFRLQVDGVSVGRPLPLLALPADSAPEGSAFPATIHLSAAAPAGGRVVLLETSDPAVASIPASVLVPEGARSVSFNVSTGAVAAPTSVVLTATDRGASVRADLRVTPIVDVASLTLAAASVVGGLPVAGTVTLAAPAIEGGVSVLLTSSDPSSASAPAAVTVPASGTTASFSVTTLPVASDRTVTLTAGAGGISKSASLAVLVPPPPARLLSVSTSHPSVVAGSWTSLVVTLTSPAPADGKTVLLSSSNPLALPVPPSLTVPQGQSSSGFAFGPPLDASDATVTITASDGELTRTVSVEVTGYPRIAGLTVGPSTGFAGESATGTLTLALAAPAGGYEVPLSSSRPELVSVPAVVVVPAGALSTTFSAVFAPSGPGGYVSISASRHGVTRSASVGVVTLASVTVSPSPAPPGAAVSVQVALTATVPDGRAVDVALSSSAPGILSVPPTAQVASGANSKSVPAVRANVTEDTPVEVTATALGDVKTRTVVLEPLKVVSVASKAGNASVAACREDVLRIRTNGPAPAEGATILVRVENGHPWGGTYVSGSTPPTFSFALPSGSSILDVRTRASWGTEPRQLVANAQLGASEASFSMGIGAGTVSASATPSVVSRGSVVRVKVIASGEVGCLSQGILDLPASSSEPSILAVPEVVRFSGYPVNGDPYYWFADLTVPASAASGTARLTFSAFGATASVDVTVPESSLSSLVVNPTAAPAGTQLAATATLDMPAPSGGLDLTLVSSDPSLVAVPAVVSIPGGTASVTVPISVVGTAPGTASVTASYRGVSQSAAVRVLSSDAVRISGRVFDESWWDYSPGLGSVAVRNSSGFHVTTSAGDGTFWAWFEADSTVMTIEKPGFVSRSVGPFNLSTGSPTDLGDIGMEKVATGGCHVFGRVVDTAGEPIEGAAIKLVGYDLSSTTGPDGGFELEGPLLERHRIRVSKQGFATVVHDVSRVDSIYWCDFSPPGDGLEDITLPVDSLPHATAFWAYPPVVEFGETPALRATLSGPPPSWGGWATYLDLSTNIESMNDLAGPSAALSVANSGTELALQLPWWIGLENSNNTGSPITRLHSFFYGGATKVAAITYLPSGQKAFFIWCHPPTVRGGSTRSCQVRLGSDSAPPGGLTVALSSTSQLASLPASVAIPAGVSSAGFSVSTSLVRRLTPVTISAVSGERTASLVLDLTPSNLASVILSSPRALPGFATTGAVWLDGPAPAGGFEVALATDSSDVTVPAAVTIPQGESSADFPVTIGAAAPIGFVRIAASLDMQRRSALLEIGPHRVTQLALSPTSVPAGATATGTISIDLPAPEGGLVVEVASSHTSTAQVPGSVLVPAGGRQASFTVTTSPVTAATSVTITATLAGSSRIATLEVRVPPPTLTGAAPGVALPGASGIVVYGTNLGAATSVLLSGPVYPLGGTTPVCNIRGAVGPFCPEILAVAAPSADGKTLTFSLPANAATGTYLLEVKAGTVPSTNGVPFLVEQAQPAFEVVAPEDHKIAQRIHPGQTVEGILAGTAPNCPFGATDYNQYFFFGTAGSRVNVRMERVDSSVPWSDPSSLDPQVEIVAPDGFVYGNLVRFNDRPGVDYNATLTNARLPMTGLYVILAETARGRGAYRLSFSFSSLAPASPDDRVLPAAGNHVTGHVGDSITSWAQVLDPRGHPLSGAAIAFQQLAEPGDNGTIQFTSGANVSSSSLGVASVRATLASYGRVRFAPLLQQTYEAPASSTGGPAVLAAEEDSESAIPLYPAVAMRPYSVGHFDGERLVVESTRFERFALASRAARKALTESAREGKGLAVLGAEARPSPPAQPYGPEEEAKGEVPMARVGQPGLLAATCVDGLRFHTFAVLPSTQINAPLRVTLEDLTPSTGQGSPNGAVDDRGIYGHRIEKEIRLRVRVLDSNGNEPDYPVLVSVSVSGRAAGTVILDPDGARVECPAATFVWHERDANGVIVAMNDVIGYRLGTYSEFLGVDRELKPVWNFTEMLEMKTFTPGQEEPSVQVFGVHPEPGKPDRIFCRDYFGQLCGDSFRFWAGHRAYLVGKKSDGSDRYATDFYTMLNAYTLVDKYENTIYGYRDSSLSAAVPAATVQFLSQAPGETSPDQPANYKVRARWTNDPAWPTGTYPATISVSYPNDPDWSAGEVTRAISLVFESGTSRALSKHSRYDLIRPDGTRGVDDGTFPIRTYSQAGLALLPKTEAADGVRLVLLAYRGEVVPGEWPELEPTEAGSRVWAPEGDHWRLVETRSSAFLETQGPSEFRFTLIDHDWNVIPDGEFAVHRCPRFDHSSPGAARPCALAPVTSVNGRIDSLQLNPGGASGGDSRGYLGIELTRAPEGPGTYFVKVESVSREYRIRREADFVTSSGSEDADGEFQGAFKIAVVSDYPCPDSRCGPAACNSCTGSPNYVSTGTYTTSATDIVVPTSGPAIAVSRNYLSTPGPDGVVGPGWTSSLEARVYLAPYLSGGVRLGTEANVVLPAGLRYKFRLNPLTGGFDPPPGRRDDLVRNVDGTFTLFLERGSGAVYRFDEHGRLASESDEYGNVVTWERDAQGRVSRITDSSGTGRWLTVGWTSGGKVHALTDSASRTVTYDYDSQGRLAGVTDPAGRRTQYDYRRGRESPALLTRVSDPWGRALTDVTYDSADRTSTYTEQGVTYTYTYLEPTRSRKTDDSGNASTYTFDPSSGVITTRSSADDAFSKVVDAEGRPTQVTDAAGVVTGYSYDDEGHVLTVTRNAGQAGAVRYDYAYDPSFPDKVASVTPRNPATNALDASWQGWRYEYHPIGSTRPGGLKTVYRIATDGTTADAVSRYEYDGQGRVTRQTTAGGGQTDYAYDSEGNLQTVTGPAGTEGRPVTTYQHDALGRVTVVTDPLGKVTHYTYDALGRVLTVTLPAVGGRSFATSYSYDHLDAATGLLYTEITDPNGRLTRLGYDVDGRLRRSVDAAGGATLYGYTGKRLTTITDPNGNVTTYGYDGAGRLATTTFPDGGQETYVYWNDGLLRQKTDRRGTVIGYVYDAFKRLVTKTYSTGGSVTYAYDGQKLLSVTDTTVTPAETHSFGYDARYRLSSAAQAGRGTLAYTYNADDRVETLSLSSGPTAAYAYHPDGSLHTLQWSPVPGAFSWDYTARGQYDTVTFPSGQTRTYAYDDQGRLTSLANALGASTLASYAYGYDVDPQTGQPTLLGQRTSQTATLPTQGLANAATSYGYDPLYQLIRAEYPASAPFNSEVHTWSYDSIGNRLTQGIGASVQTYTYLKSQGNPLNGQRLAGDGVDAMTYDPAGNLATRQGPAGSFTFGYDPENRLKTITGAETATYTYDYQGRRTSKTVAGVTTTYLYDGLNLVSETTNGQTTYFVNGPGIDEPLAMSKAGVISYFSVDALGSVVATNDPAGTVTHSVVFDAWGSVKAETGTRTHPFTYTGREVGEAGFHFYRARFYQPSIGRFTQEDPAEIFEEFYTYVRNSPQEFVDPTGLVLQPLVPKGDSREDLSRAELEKRMSPRAPLSPDVKKDLDRGCVGLCAAYQRQGMGSPEFAPGTLCFLSESLAATRNCGKGRENFVFAKQGQWTDGAPWPAKDGSVPPTSISNGGGYFNYVTRFAGRNGKPASYAWMNNGTYPGAPEQEARVSWACPNYAEYPRTIWCSTCAKGATRR